MKKFELVLISLVFTISCKNDILDPIGDNQEIVDFVNVKKFESLISPRDLMNEVEFIKLNTPEGFKLTIAAKIETFDDKILILDGKKNILVAFDSEGNYIAQVGKKGEGPEEYKEVSDFNINYQTKTINIFSRADHAIIQFDYNLRFIKRIKIESWASQFSILESNQFAFYAYLGEEDTKFNINLYNLNGKKSGVRMKIPQNDNFVALNYSGFIKNEYYSYPLSSMIYKIREDQNNDSLVYSINFPNKLDEEKIFDYDSYLYPTDKVKKNILGKFEIGNDSEFLCYYQFREGTSNGFTLGVKLSNGETFGHYNLNHAAKNKSDIYIRMFFIGPYNLPSYSKDSQFYYVTSNIDAVAVYYDEIKQRIKNKDVYDSELLELLENTDLEETILMKFKLKTTYEKG